MQQWLYGNLRQPDYPINDLYYTAGASILRGPESLRVEYSSHALMRLRVRRISRGEVEALLLTPREVYFDIATGNLIALGERRERQDH